VPAASVIGDVSLTLVQLLDGKLFGTSVVVSDLQTAPSGDVLSLFLYEVAEDPSARNRPLVREGAPPNVVIKKPPLALMLRYLLTPWHGDPKSAHRVLGRVMQLFYDNAILSGSQLQGTALTGTAEALKIMLIPLTLEDRTRIWHAIQKPYRLSVTYEVRVVNIDTEKEERVRAVRSRTLEPGELVRAGQ
jgi:hypothetical protein